MEGKFQRRNWNSDLERWS